MTDDPASYPWTSYHHNALGQRSELITAHKQYISLASTPTARQAAYRALVCERIEEQHLDDLRQHTQKQRVWGSQRFQEHVEALTQRPVSVTPRGRPPKPAPPRDK